MHNNPNEINKKRFYYSLIRTDVHNLLLGPTSFYWQHDHDSFYGWSVLSLHMRLGWEDRNEVRTVYGNLFDSSQDYSVLRAVFWNGIVERAKVRKEKEAYIGQLPARFIEIPVSLLREWLNEFDDLSLKIDLSSQLDESVKVRRLRIERDYYSEIFEYIWQKENELFSELNNKWQKVWDQMTELLSSSKIVTDFSEEYSAYEGRVHYNLDAYSADIFDH
ncbi:MAG: hypothetical protein HXX08_22765 [Chloroflexi bacterium]|uniref:Uncharacterized protein n=1 Tax=Candidatus Chlorohelix allophototropha TaxID=3003348 RepID=A0A8T7M9L4_9CHLR|nr:hypothetical protein [Chloroflexota bacterium]WJW68624.1 hypothetical protein OZ401_004238 [Chloroflexota bacterium L227-S17]